MGANLINMWNYGVFIDENNMGVTHHLGYFGWYNILFAVAGLIVIVVQSTKKRKERKYDEQKI